MRHPIKNHYYYAEIYNRKDKDNIKVYKCIIQFKKLYRTKKGSYIATVYNVQDKIKIKQYVFNSQLKEFYSLFTDSSYLGTNYRAIKTLYNIPNRDGLI